MVFLFWGTQYNCKYRYIVLYISYSYCCFRGLEGGENISKMKVPINDTAKFALIRGTIIKGDITQFRAALQKYPVLIDEQKFLLALEDLCLNDKHLWLPEVWIFLQYTIQFVKIFMFSAFKYCNTGIVFTKFRCRRANALYQINSARKIRLSVLYLQKVCEKLFRVRLCKRAYKGGD